MLTQRLALWTLIAVASALSTGCGQGKKKDDKASQDAPEAQGEGDESFDQELAAEYQSLPATVIIAADADADGKAVAGTEEMRAPGGDAATGSLANANQAEAAYDAGTPVTTAAEGDELDQDSSTQSWSQYKGTDDFNRYEPKVYSKKKKGYAYSYGKVKPLRKGRRVIYVYYRPACRPKYCRPDGGQPGNPGQYPDGQYPDGGYKDLDAELRAAFKQYDVIDVTDAQFHTGSPEKIELGARLFYDKLLSAHNDMSCASCHIQKTGTTSFYSLGPTGEVMMGRKQGPFGRNDLIARNAPALYNVGHKSLGTMFWDSRVSVAAHQPSGYYTPVGDNLPPGLESALAVQALFPMISAAEMGCGIIGEGSQESLEAPQRWNAIVTRVLARQDYQVMFAAAYPEAQGQFGVQHIANAIAAFESEQWRAINSPFDRYVRGDLKALTQVQKIGASYFYGKAKCGTCHSGSLQTDHGRHAIAIPQFGPGAGDGAAKYEDFGFGRISRKPEDNFKFKTPSLRNVSMSGPWGHNGAYRSLRSFVEHYRDPVRTHDQWTPDQVILPRGFYMDQDVMGAWADPAARERVKAAAEIGPTPMTDAEVEAIVQFLLSLTDPAVAQNETAVIGRR